MPSACAMKAAQGGQAMSVSTWPSTHRDCLHVCRMPHQAVFKRTGAGAIALRPSAVTLHAHCERQAQHVSLSGIRRPAQPGERAR